MNPFASPQDLFRRLAELGIETRTTEHPPVFTVEEAQRVRGAIPGVHMKNLFLKDVRGSLWLVVAREDRCIDLKELARRVGAKRFSFGNPELLMASLGVEAGGVTPFGVINDREGRVRVVLDRAAAEAAEVNFHPLTNAATTTISSAGLLRFLADTGHEPLVLDL